MKGDLWGSWVKSGDLHREQIHHDSPDTTTTVFLLCRTEEQSARGKIYPQCECVCVCVERESEREREREGERRRWGERGSKLKSA